MYARPDVRHFMFGCMRYLGISANHHQALLFLRTLFTSLDVLGSYCSSTSSTTSIKKNRLLSWSTVTSRHESLMEYSSSKTEKKLGPGFYSEVHLPWFWCFALPPRDESSGAKWQATVWAWCRWKDCRPQKTEYTKSINYGWALH